MMNNSVRKPVTRRQVLKILGTGAILPWVPASVRAAIKISSLSETGFDDSYVKDYLYRINNFDQASPCDYSVLKEDYQLLVSARDRFRRLQRLVGYANFSLFSIDEALKTGKSHVSVGPFTKKELTLLEMLFYRDSSIYGFLGKKPFQSFSSEIKKEKTVKIKGTGQYLYKGGALKKFLDIRNKIGQEVILTSGIRGMAKQFYLFLNKAVKSGGNLSMVSRSLAPPGYSLHGTGDFDVGQRRFGVSNFSIEFTRTNVYRQLIESGFSDFRYTKNNVFGVRFEPWHIKVGNNTD